MNNKTIVVLSNVSAGLVNFRIELLQSLTKDYRVVVIAQDTGRKDELLKLGCEFINVKIERHGTNPLSELRLVTTYRKCIKKHKPFVVLSYTIKPNIYGGIACRLTKTPYIPNVTGLGDAIENKGLFSSIVRNLYKIGLRHAQIVFFQNQANCDFFMVNSLYDVLPGSGVNLDKHCYEQYPDNNIMLPIVLSVIGRVTKDKGINEILEAAKRLKDLNLKIQLIGDCEGNYIESIREAERDGIITYLGRQDNVHQWITKSHAVLHASYHEGMANVLLEAASCGRPILATNVPGCAETFDEGVSGFGFEPKNVASLVETVERFIDLPHHKKVQMGLAGRKKMEESFDRNIVIKRYIKAIKKIEREKQNESL